MDGNRGISSALLWILTTRKTTDSIVRVPREEERDTEALLATCINNAVQIRQVPIIRPVHHHTPQVDNIRPRTGSDIGPFRREIIPYLQPARIILQEHRDSAEIRMCADS